MRSTKKLQKGVRNGNFASPPCLGSTLPRPQAASSTPRQSSLRGALSLLWVSHSIDPFASCAGSNTSVSWNTAGAHTSASQSNVCAAARQRRYWEESPQRGGDTRRLTPRPVRQRSCKGLEGWTGTRE